MFLALRKGRTKTVDILLRKYKFDLERFLGSSRPRRLLTLYYEVSVAGVFDISIMFILVA